MRLGCYHAADGGHFIAHRDDATPYSVDRRFAMSLALSTGEYEGGYVRCFPEYGPQLFRAEIGSDMSTSRSSKPYLLKTPWNDRSATNTGR